MSTEYVRLSASRYTNATSGDETATHTTPSRSAHAATSVDAPRTTVIRQTRPRTHQRAYTTA